MTSPPNLNPAAPSSETAADDGARAHLRARTLVAHKRLECLLPLQSAELSLATYVSTLRRFLSIYETLEQRLVRYEPALDALGYDSACRRKVPLIQRDLAALTDSSWVAPPPTRAAPLPPDWNVAHVMGCLYVVEGSTLGGVIISRHVEKLLHLGPESGAAFFHGYGSATGMRWKSLCALLERGLPDPALRDQAVVGANHTFRLFTEYLSDPNHDPVLDPAAV